VGQERHSPRAGDGEEGIGLTSVVGQRKKQRVEMGKVPFGKKYEKGGLGDRGKENLIAEPREMRLKTPEGGE